MPIVLTWTESNSSEDGHAVYRSSSPIDPESLPPPLAVLGANVNSYTDSAVSEGDFFYYRVAAKRGGELAVSDQIAVEATPAPTLPTVIGQAFGGGYYIGDITVADGGASDGVYALIMAGKAAEVQRGAKTSISLTAGATSLTDGRSNTTAMEAAGIEQHPAAQHCVTYAAEGYADWYLPAEQELLVAAQNLASLTALEFVPQLDWAGRYWSSSVWSSQFCRAVNIRGNFAENEYWTWAGGYVRPVRRIKKS